MFWFLTSGPGDLQSTFIKVEDSKTKEGLRVKEVTGESLSSALLWLPNFWHLWATLEEELSWATQHH